MSNTAPEPVTHLIARLLAEHATGILVLTWEGSGRQRRVRIHNGGVVDASNLTDLKAALRSASAHFDPVDLPGARGHRRPLELLLAEHSEWRASQPGDDATVTAVPELEDDSDESATDESATDESATDESATDNAPAAAPEPGVASDPVPDAAEPEPWSSVKQVTTDLLDDLSAESSPPLAGEDEPIVTYSRGPDPVDPTDLVSDPSVDPFTDPDEVFLDEGGMFTMRPRTWSAPDRTPPRQRAPGGGDALPPPSEAESVVLMDEDEEPEELVEVEVDSLPAPASTEEEPVPFDQLATVPQLPEVGGEPEVQVLVPARPQAATARPAAAATAQEASDPPVAGVPAPGPPPDPGPGGELTRNIVLDLVTRADAEAGGGRLIDAEDTLVRAFRVHDMRIVRIRLAEVMVRLASGAADDRLARAEALLAAMPDDGRNPEATEIRLRIAAARHAS